MERCSGTAVWRHAGLPAVPIRWVRLRDPHRRFDPQALLCTDTAQDPPLVVCWFVQRWQLEVTFRGVRDPLGVESQRRWSDKAIGRTTPCLLGPFSIVAPLATRLGNRARLWVPATAWYHKARPTFSDTLAATRRQIRTEQGLITSRQAAETTKLHPALRAGIAYALCHAAGLAKVQIRTVSHPADRHGARPKPLGKCQRLYRTPLRALQCVGVGLQHVRGLPAGALA